MIVNILVSGVQFLKENWSTEENKKTSLIEFILKIKIPVSKVSYVYIGENYSCI